MTILLSVVALTLFCVLPLLDFKANKGNNTSGFIMRIISSAGSIALIAVEYLSAPFEMNELIVDLATGNAILLLYPCSYERPGFSLKTAIVFLAVSLAVLLSFSLLPPGTIRYRHQRLVCSVNVIMFFCIFYYCFVAVKKFHGLRFLFRNTAVWHSIEDYSRFIFLMIYMVICVFAFCSLQIPGDAGIVFVCLSSVCLITLYSILYVKALSGRTCILQKTQEDRIKEMIKGNLRTTCADKVSEDTRMNALYKRIMDYMTDKKPYLDSSFDMTELADKLFSNKLYLSKTINIQSGRNFRQFINYHRINYALDLMKKDPRLRVSEVSDMSGFHSVVSFNMAFKINTGQTPSDWMRDYLASGEYNP